MVTNIRIFGNNEYLVTVKEFMGDAVVLPLHTADKRFLPMKYSKDIDSYFHFGRHAHQHVTHTISIKMAFSKFTVSYDRIFSFLLSPPL